MVCVLLTYELQILDKYVCTYVEVGSGWIRLENFTPIIRQKSGSGLSQMHLIHTYKLAQTRVLQSLHRT
jgi:hypothetical protein